ncbi:hypothetical protein B7P43_G09459 [Cryptotermes secundus]|uniref:Uncharacterized protein n=1 Tax=Cryptotermes secundus TaxID=105785 RepID=A0A2J7R2J8_9NEOP|nr:hypothetical protein B7P43_G09459 [Cryptotermes secundus]
MHEPCFLTAFAITMSPALCVVILTLSVLSAVGALKNVDVELIPEEQKTVSADVGKSLSLGVDNSEWKRRNFVDMMDDQMTAGSEYYGPAVIGSYAEQQKKEGDSYKLQDAKDTRGEVGFYGIARQKGSRGRVSEDGYTADHQSTHRDKQNSGYYGDKNGAHKAYDAGRSSYGGQDFNRQGQAGAAYGARGGRRKGHHSTGFKNSYHKDESGNKSRFFDDSNDEVGHYLYDSRDGTFRDRGVDTHHGKYEGGAYQDTARGKQGKFGASAAYDDSQGHKGRYANDEYHKDKTGYNQQQGGESFGRNLQGNRNEEAGRLYHEVAGGHVRPPIVGHVSPSGIYNYEGDSGYYSPKAHHTEINYPVPYTNIYKDKLGEQGAYDGPIHDGELKGKGYAEYIDTGASEYYPETRAEIDNYDEPNYYSSIN